MAVAVNRYDDAVQLPFTLGAYQLTELLGEGGMAEVYGAHVVDSGARVCVKVMRPAFATEPGAAAMFRDEAFVTAQLVHPNIVRVLDFGTANAQLYLVMERVDGKNARELCREPMPPWTAAYLASEIARGLAFAHALTDPNGRALALVHRDVSPHNVLVSNAGDVKVADFGIAKIAFGRETHTKTGMIKGKMTYMAPEQLQGLPLDHRVDQFALGVCLWQFLTGQALYTGASAEVVRAILSGVVRRPSSVNPNVPGALDVICARMLARDPGDRYPDTNAAYRALQHANPAAATTSRADLARWVCGPRQKPSAPSDPAVHARTTLVVSPRGLPVATLVAVGALGVLVGVGWHQLRSPSVGGDACLHTSTDPAELARAADQTIKAQRALEAGELSQAEMYADAALAIRGSARAHLTAGTAAWVAKNHALALRHYTCIMQVWPDSEEARTARQVLRIDPVAPPN